jgi:4-amino-4-deoxy-L-arabinose transferase-like glycosyltransferase
MPGVRLGSLALACLIFLSALALLPGLGSSSRLTYHEAFVAQGAREMLDSGNWVYPRIGGLPWLEKPPLPWWLVAVLGRCTGGVNETIARLPSALAAMALVLGVAILATRHYGAYIGLLAGAIQATTAWTVIRGRLAEADILLACLITWALLSFDQFLADPAVQSGECNGNRVQHWRGWRWAFVVLVGTTSLVKGIGFGAVLVLSVVAGVLLWRRDLISFRRLRIPSVWVLAVAIALSWPLLVIVLHGYDALSLWTMHVSDRLIRQQGPGPFAGEPWWEYGSGLLAQALPWTPFALVGAWYSLVRALMGGKRVNGGAGSEVPIMIVADDRLLWVWAVVPLGMLTLAPVKNAHYAISTQVPWSIWAALALARFGGWLRYRGFAQSILTRGVYMGFTALALAYGLGLGLLGPFFDRRGVEWTFYEAVGRQIPADMTLALLYDDWDRNPYESPFGRIPHDLAVRLFYLRRSACWHTGSGSLLADEHIASGFSPIMSCFLAGESVKDGQDKSIAVIGRDRDVPMLEQFGEVKVMARGPSLRRDRAYALFRVTRGQSAFPYVGRVETRERY